MLKSNVHVVDTCQILITPLPLYTCDYRVLSLSLSLYTAARNYTIDNSGIADPFEVTVSDSLKGHLHIL